MSPNEEGPLPAFEPVRYAALTDVGVKRSHNQDACAADPAANEAVWAAQGHVFVVADGMGGHAVGEKASAKAVRDIPFLYQKHARDGVIPALRRAFQETNTGIYTVGQENPEFRGLGTTSTALILRPEGAWVGHVGDSRAYRIRNGVAEQLTFDHSWVWEIARRQGVDPDELGDFKKNVIIRSLGPDPEVEVDIEGPHPVETGDAFLLCSDGLTGVVPPDDIGAIVTSLPPDEAARLLVNLANLRGGPDNITVLIVHVGDRTAGDADENACGGAIAKLIREWNRRVPWPFTVLAAGCGLTLLSLLMHVNEVFGASILFLLAAAVMLAGIVGLILHVRQEPPEAEALVEEGPRQLNVYKRHNCLVTATIIEKFVQIETALIETMKTQGTVMDWEAHARSVAAAEGDPKKASDLTTFRARCRSLLMLADAYHKSRNKEETFRPSWTSPTRA